MFLLLDPKYEVNRLKNKNVPIFNNNLNSDPLMFLDTRCLRKHQIVTISGRGMGKKIDIVRKTHSKFPQNFTALII